MPKRKLNSWIEGFLDYTSELGSPTIFCRWAGLVTLAGALERKVWIKTKRGVLYPNIYVLLVGPPGVGKTLATAVAYDLLSELEDHHIASTNVSRASLVDNLREAERRIIRPDRTPSIVSFNSLTILSDELGVLIPSYENDFMNTLTNIYDGRVYSERKRTRDLNYMMENPQLSMIAATTPSFLTNLLPEGAWDQGFLSRTTLVYSGETILQPIWGEDSRTEELFKDLLHDLKIIGDLYEKMTFSEEAARTVGEWHLKGGPPTPEHPKLTHYTTRRTAHLLKLCMLAAVSRTDEPVIQHEDVTTALDWLLEAEALMGDIFKSMTTGGDSRVIDECWYFAYQIWMKEKRPIPEARIVRFISERAPAHSVGRILEIMIKVKILEERLEPKIGKCYVPRARKTA